MVMGLEPAGWRRGQDEPVFLLLEGIGSPAPVAGEGLTAILKSRRGSFFCAWKGLVSQKNPSQKNLSVAILMKGTEFHRSFFLKLKPV